MVITTRSITKRQKLSEEENTDRLSALPDDIICRILSCLTTKFSVSTSILAKRWRFLWAHVPYLAFSGKVKPDIIHRVMVLHKVKTLTTFFLSHMSHCNEYQLKTWITIAIERNVQILKMHRVTPMLPLCIFTCKTLVHLCLVECAGFLSSGSPVYLPSLKELFLGCVPSRVEEYLPHLLSGCPVLKELRIIDQSKYPNLGCYNISSPSIERLKVYSPFVNNNGEDRVVINAPALRYLLIDNCYYDQMSLSPMTSLIEAVLRLYGSKQARDYCTLSLRKLFYYFPNVKCLKLFGRCKEDEFPVAAAGSIVKFDNLTKLDLGVDWCFLTKFLETADNLEELIIREVHDDQRNWIEPKKELLFRSLKIVTVHHFCCTEQELRMVKYILRNAKVLKRMEIHSGGNYVGLMKIIDTLKRILLFHRGSTECEVAFV